MKRMGLSTLCGGAMAPGRKLMRRLPLPSKLGLLALFAFAPLLALLAYVMVTARTDFAVLSRERDGVAAIRMVYGLAHGLDLRRRDLQRVQAWGGQPSDATKRQITETAAALDRYFGAHDEYAEMPHWNNMRRQLQLLTDGADRSSNAEALASLDVLGGETALLLSVVGERSELLFDPKHRSYYLMDMVVERLPPLLQGVSRVRDRVTMAVPGGELSPAERSEVVVSARNLESQMRDLQFRVEALERSGWVAASSWLHVWQLSREFVSVGRSVLDSAQLTLEPRHQAETGDHIVEATHELVDAVMLDLERELNDRQAGMQRQLAWILSFSVLGVVAVLYLAACFVQSFFGALRGVRLVVQGLSKGDLSKPFVPLGKDELAAMGADVEHTVDMLSALVAEIRNSAVRVGQAGSAVAREGEASASLCEAQMSALRRVINGVHELSQGLEGHVIGVAELRSQATQLEAMAADCDSGVGSSVEAMQDLDDSVSKVAEINAVIDDIAFQTNLLSINASVEAARAGEAGKGFGVVAAAVRALSQRCSDAAGEVRTLIEHTASQTGATRSNVAQAHRQVRSLAHAIGTLVKDQQRVDHSGAGQRQLLAELSRGVSELEGAVQGRGNGSSTSADAAAVLDAQAKALSKAVSSIRLRQGGLDEAKAMVERAQRRIAEVGWNRAVGEFNAPDGGFIDRDLFIFVVGADNKFLAHGGRPHEVGCDIHDMVGVTSAMADSLLDGARAAVAQGGGWVDYEFIQGATDEVVEKSAYVVDLGDGVFMGCGAHRLSLCAPEPRVKDVTESGDRKFQLAKLPV